MARRTGNKVPKTGFVLDTSNMDKEDLLLLQDFNFPLKLGVNKMLQKRILKVASIGVGYVERQGAADEDSYIYHSISRNVAKANIRKQEALEQQAKTDQAALQRMIKNKTAKAFEEAYLGQDLSTMQEDLQKEADYLIKAFSRKAPTLTPSMQAAQNKVTPVEEPVITEPKVKGLSNVNKSKIKALNEQKRDANEIAEELELDVDKVINYLRKLSK